jgi:hypothetical protein
VAALPRDLVEHKLIDYSCVDGGICIISYIHAIGHVRWVNCHHGMACPQVADGEDALQVWRVAANILNKQSRTADKGWFFSLGVGRGANNFHRKK